ncbi:ATP-binding protein [Dysgonomonas sp. ZJ279]|uniref:ATP-binding protein n=1 Tax=Dysgonomonas sp. ZJ279 TaxID=2709796 RepID=UPI0013EA6CD7|nr:ATP-binding protein [Dysgonomonas sp. ZJ279]
MINPKKQKKEKTELKTVKPQKTKRALSFNEIKTFKPHLLPFTGKWLESIGQPELTGAWLIWGNTGSGKTRFSWQLVKYLTQFGKVLYNSMEEGLTGTMQRAIFDVGMADVATKWQLLNREPINELKERLRKRRSADIVFIDSVQYTGMNKKQYFDLVNEFRNKLFIFLSHADGVHPRGALAETIYYDSNVHIRVEGFKGIITKSRYGGGDDYIIWDKGYRDYWNV